MAAAVQSADVSFEAKTEVSVSSTPQRWSLTPTSTEIDIIRKRVLHYNNSKPTQKMVMEAIRSIGLIHRYFIREKSTVGLDHSTKNCFFSKSYLFFQNVLKS